VLLWASRTPTLGIPVADDYLFLERARFHRVDWLGTMGAANYWRPLSRQLYFTAMAPVLTHAPWLASVLAVLLFVLLYAILYRLARRRFTPAIAAGVASFPLLAEPSRLLLVWPSGFQHLAAAVLAALAIERAVAGSLVPAVIAALLALLGNEAAWFALPALPVIAWARGLRRGELARWGIAALGVAAIWGIGYAMSLARGPRLGPALGPGLTRGVGGAAAVLGRSLVAQLGLESLPSGFHDAGIAIAVAIVLAAVGVRLFTRRARTGGGLVVVGGGLVWFVSGVAPLALIWPDWNSWRTTIASGGLGFALIGGLALASPPLAGALVGLRLVALLLAAPAPGTVTSLPPATVSSLSFERIVRLQRIVESARRVLRARHPALPRGGVVRFWNLGQLAEVGFNGSSALRVWYGDSTLVWHAYSGYGAADTRADAAVEFELASAWPARVIEPRAFALFVDATARANARDCRAADSVFALAGRAQPGDSLYFHGLVAINRADACWNCQRYVEAESLTQVGGRFAGVSANYYVLAAEIALLHHNPALAAEAVRRCLALDPREPNALAMARMLGLASVP
jgi:hypothetical protein